MYKHYPRYRLQGDATAPEGNADVSDVDKSREALAAAHRDGHYLARCHGTTVSIVIDGVRATFEPVSA